MNDEELDEIPFVFLSEEDYNKALFHARSQLAAIWNFCRCYGLQQDIDPAIEQSMIVLKDFGMVVRGDDRPIKVLDKPTVRPTD